MSKSRRSGVAQILDDLARLCERCGPWDAVLFTGDLVQSGKPEEFEAMQREFLDPLWERLDRLGSGGARLLAVPGNHDLVRPDANADDPAAETLLRPERVVDVAGRFWGNPAISDRAVIDRAFTPYSEWWAQDPRRPEGLICGTLPGDFAVSLPLGDPRSGS